MRRTALILLVFSLMLLLCAVLASHRISAQVGGSADNKIPKSMDKEISRVEAQMDQIESDTLSAMGQTALDRAGQIRTLGKLLLFDKNLSVHRNEACSFCHTPETGFTGPIEALNRTTVAYPGSVRNRYSQRKPQSYMYATFAPVLHYNALQGDFVGGNFWDMRASGYRLQSPAAEQAQGPPTNPVEMGLPDSACVAYRLSQSPYRSLFEKVWGAASFDITWPANAEKVCATSAPPPANDQYPVHLSASGRQRADRDYDGMGLAIAAYEASPEVDPFTSKFDNVQAGKAQFTPQEDEGYKLFRGKAGCNACHRDGGPGEEPLFTDFTASNLGVPRNPALPYYDESQPDAQGYRANPDGAAFEDEGVGFFLRKLKSLSGQLNPDSQWIQYAPKFDYKFQVPTLRNVDMRPRADFVKAYMHNGYFKSLKEVVHFYNTRDTLARCKPNDPGEKVSCWPAPENATNLNTRQLGNLHLTPAEEDAVVAFLQTLTDGYKVPQSAAKASRPAITKAGASARTTLQQDAIAR